MLERIAEHPNIVGIYLATDTLYYDPVASALKSRGRLLPLGQPGHIPVVAIDGGSGALKAIRDGFLDATISQPVTDYAKYGVQYLSAALKGEAMKAPPPKPMIAMPGRSGNHRIKVETGEMYPMPSPHPPSTP
jgi:ribose transport system substrate-binding protein